ncbi:MAG: hypothetical protein M3R72_06365, partial [Bacteroidota bacterium]|nr:hypothetical protein [Bacteroidota bacterium]
MGQKQTLSHSSLLSYLTLPCYLCGMKYQVGDEIIVLHSNEEGKVIEILNDKMVMIEVRGVKFPAYMDQIDFPYFHRFTKKTVVPQPKKPKQYIDNLPKEKGAKTNVQSEP